MIIKIAVKIVNLKFCTDICMNELYVFLISMSNTVWFQYNTRILYYNTFHVLFLAVMYLIVSFIKELVKVNALSLYNIVTWDLVLRNFFFLQTMSYLRTLFRILLKRKHIFRIKFYYIFNKLCF